MAFSEWLTVKSVLGWNPIFVMSQKLIKAGAKIGQNYRFWEKFPCQSIYHSTPREFLSVDFLFALSEQIKTTKTDTRSTNQTQF